MVEVYTTMYNEYLSKLHNWFITIPNPSKYKKSNAASKQAIVQFFDMFSAITFDLDHALNNIKINFNSSDIKDELNSFDYELSQADGLYELKRVFNNFVLTLDENNYILKRLYMLEVLENIHNALIIEDYSDFPYIYSWYRRFILL